MLPSKSDSLTPFFWGAAGEVDEGEEEFPVCFHIKFVFLASYNFLISLVTYHTIYPITSRRKVTLATDTQNILFFPLSVVTTGKKSRNT